MNYDWCSDISLPYVYDMSDKIIILKHFQVVILPFEVDWLIRALDSMQENIPP